tara:strand:- start:587 stop:796 length:210 start_codon:yes stop_codon:yes gene_type:complete
MGEINIKDFKKTEGNNKPKEAYAIGYTLKGSPEVYKALEFLRAQTELDYKKYVGKCILKALEDAKNKKV